MRHRTLYCHMVYESSKQKQIKIRMDLVHYAQKNGIKPTAKKFCCSKNTVKLWLKRHHYGGSSALIDRSKKPHCVPHQTSKEVEEQIIHARLQVPCYGPKRLKWFFDISASEGAIQRILKCHRLTRKRRKKYKVKNDLRAVKAHYQAFTHHQEDVKHLYDQPFYWPQMYKLNLPKYQYSLRDTKSGAICLGFGSEYSEFHSKLFTEKFLNHLKDYNIGLERVIIQTDNGGEFGGQKRNLSSPGFVNMIQEHFGAKHQYIPPGCSNANADVESIHSTIEQEFFDLENFTSREDFFRKAQVYQYFYNVVRPNFSKQGKTPVQILMEDRPEIDSKMILFPVIDLDQLFRVKCCPENLCKRGQPLPVLPGNKVNAL